MFMVFVNKNFIEFIEFNIDGTFQSPDIQMPG